MIYTYSKYSNTLFAVSTSGAFSAKYDPTKKYVQGDLMEYQNSFWSNFWEVQQVNKEGDYLVELAMNLTKQEVEEVSKEFNGGFIVRATSEWDYRLKEIFEVGLLVGLGDLPPYLPGRIAMVEDFLLVCSRKVPCKDCDLRMRCNPIQRYRYVENF